MSATCTICSDILNLSSEDLYATKCGHVFHYACLLQWIERSESCPQCRCETTESDIHSIYFNVGDHTMNDVELQPKLVILETQISLTEEDLKTSKERCRKYKKRNAALRLGIAKEESRSEFLDCTVVSLRKKMFSNKLKLIRLAEKNSKLMKTLRTLESEQMTVTAMMEETKKALFATEGEKLYIYQKYKLLQNNFAKLEKTNAELRKKIESSKTAHNVAGIKRIILESPAPLPKKLRSGSETKIPICFWLCTKTEKITLTKGDEVAQNGWTVREKQK